MAGSGRHVRDAGAVAMMGELSAQRKTAGQRTGVEDAMQPHQSEATGPPASSMPSAFTKRRNEVHRFASILREAVRELDALPESLCPNDEVVVSFWFRREGRPQEDLLLAMSRIAPVRVVGSRLPEPMPSASAESAVEWFVAGSRASFRRISEEAATWRPSQQRAALAGTVARVTPPVPTERVRTRWEESGMKALEVVLHAGEGAEDRHVVEGFRRYLGELDLRPHRDRVLFAGRLGFLGLIATAEEALEIARFAFVRVVREMPRLRPRRQTGLNRMTLPEIPMPGASVFGIGKRLTIFPVEGLQQLCSSRGRRNALWPHGAAGSERRFPTGIDRLEAVEAAPKPRSPHHATFSCERSGVRGNRSLQVREQESLVRYSMGTLIFAIAARGRLRGTRLKTHVEMRSEYSQCYIRSNDCS